MTKQSNRSIPYLESITTHRWMHVGHLAHEGNVLGVAFEEVKFGVLVETPGQFAVLPEVVYTINFVTFQIPGLGRGRKGRRDNCYSDGKQQLSDATVAEKEISDNSLNTLCGVSRSWNKNFSFVRWKLVEVTNLGLQYQIRTFSHNLTPPDMNTHISIISPRASVGWFQPNELGAQGVTTNSSETNKKCL